MAYTDYELKSALPNKSYNEDGTTTDLLGNVVQNPVPEYENKQSLPNKWLNPDGSYSTLLELISGAIDTEIFVVVEELPETGEPNKIYLVPNEKGELDEFCWVNNEWDPIGMLEFDLSQYSTTDEMNAAILAALNSAKAYTDEQIAGISVDPQVFYWDGNKGEIGVTLWQKVVEANKNTDVIVNGENMIRNTVTHNVFTIIPKGRLYNNLITYGYSEIGFMYQTMTTNPSTPSYSTLNDTMSTVKLYDDDKEGVVKSIEHRSNATLYGRMQYLALDYDYPSPYTPQYDGSPATKKYVDDSITTNITNVLGGSY